MLFELKLGAIAFFCEIVILGYHWFFSSCEIAHDTLVSEGWCAHALLKKNELGHDELKVMLNRLGKYKDCYMLFMKDYSVPFTNNLAERDLRPSKTKQKVSGCFRSWSGIKNYAKTRSFISTAKKRHLNLLESILSILKGIPVFAVK